MKKLTCRLCCLFLCIGLLVPATLATEQGLHNFKAVNQYRHDLFTDVSSADWYSDVVRVAYELGLVRGNSATTFNPSGNMKISEAIVLASRLHSTYYANGTDFTQGNPWYQVYVDYAFNNGIISYGQFKDYDAYATRADFALMLSATLPDEALTAINTVDSIPDVYGYEAYANAVYKLYNAGILTGNDAQGTFTPYNTIKRSEVAAIVSRMAVPALRKEFTLSKVVETPTLNPQTPTEPTTPTMINIKGNIGAEVKTLNLKVGESATFWVTAYGDNTIVTSNYNSYMANISWGDWNGTQIQLTVTALQVGYSQLEVFIEQEPTSCIYIDVWGAAQDTTSIIPSGTGNGLSNTGSLNSTLNIEGVGQEYEHWWSAKIRNTSRLVSAEYEIENVVDKYIVIEVKVLAELLECIGGATSIRFECELFDDRGICVQTGRVFINASHTNQLYEDTITFYGLEPGNYTLKFKDQYK